MNTTILLCNCNQLDASYNHSVTFNSRDSQWAWFTSKTVYALNEQMYQRKTETEIRVDKHISQLSAVNYCCILNDDNTKYFYFIVDKVYCNEYTTTLFLQLDVIQTYLFSIQFAECLIERQHVNNWVNGLPNYEMLSEDEGIGTGEYVINNVTTLFDYSNKGSYVIEATRPLGVTGESTSNESGDSIVNQGDRDLVIAKARECVGSDYVWGGESFAEGGFDCSGLCYYAYQEAGLLTRVEANTGISGRWTTYSMADHFTHIAYEDLQPGDFILCSYAYNEDYGATVPEHVMMFVKYSDSSPNSKIVVIHAPEPGRKVEEVEYDWYDSYKGYSALLEI